MKKMKKLMVLFTCATLSATPVTAETIPAAAESTATTETPAPTVTPKPAKVKRGWVILKNGKKRYYRNGKRLLGFQKIGKNYFYFNKNGIMQINKTIPNGTKGYTYYTNRNGPCLCRKQKAPNTSMPTAPVCPTSSWQKFLSKR